MQLTVLGCSGSVPGPDSPASGYLVRSGDTAVVLDLGNGTLGAMQREIDPFDLDAVILSHLHPDHCADVSAMTVFRRYHPAPPHRRPLPLYGPACIAERLIAAYATDVDDRIVTDLSDVYEYRQLRESAQHEPIRIGPMVITAALMEHPCEAYAIRIQVGDTVLVYSGDTGPCPQLANFSQGANLFLAEASWPHTDTMPKGVHMSGREAGEAAAKAQVGRLVLTHVPPWTDAQQVLREATEVYDGPIELATPGVGYDI